MKKILLVATGSVAVIKTKKLKDLLENKYEVKVIVTPCVYKNFEKYKLLKAEKEDNSLFSFPSHIKNAKWPDLIVVAPATANTISKYWAGINDNQVLSTLIASRAKILFAPSMNTYMYKSLVDRNIFQNISMLGHMFIGPNIGPLREGDIGLGRMSEPEEIFEAINKYFCFNKKAIVVYGASKIYIDPIRFISNDSTGAMGKFISNELRINGFEVLEIDISKYTNKELIFFLQNKLSDCNLYISPAAFADFYVKMHNSKIKKNTINSIKLKKNIDVISVLSKKFKNVKFIGFKLDNNINNAKNKLKKLNIEAILWNKIGSMGSAKITGSLIFCDKQIDFKNTNKLDVAKMIVKECG